jgi:hypothetical protein
LERRASGTVQLDNLQQRFKQMRAATTFASKFASHLG